MTLCKRCNKGCNKATFSNASESACGLQDDKNGGFDVAAEDCVLGKQQQRSTPMKNDEGTNRLAKEDVSVPPPQIVGDCEEEGKSDKEKNCRITHSKYLKEVNAVRGTNIHGPDVNQVEDNEEDKNHDEDGGSSNCSKPKMSLRKRKASVLHAGFIADINNLSGVRETASGQWVSSNFSVLVFDMSLHPRISHFLH